MNKMLMKKLKKGLGKVIYALADLICELEKMEKEMSV